MSTRIEVDNALLEEAMALFGKATAVKPMPTSREVVEVALKEFIQHLHRQMMLDLRGKVQWEGNLDQMRQA